MLDATLLRAIHVRRNPPPCNPYEEYKVWVGEYSNAAFDEALISPIVESDQSKVRETPRIRNTSDPKSITIAVSVAGSVVLPEQWMDALWTYRLALVDLPINKCK